VTPIDAPWQASTPAYGDILGTTAKMQRIFKLVAKVAPTESTVLILGESGTGKELIARAIHLQSRRQNGAFVPVNCAALPESLIESELFGYVRGAFTGAAQSRRGLIEEAEGGTLFLDEIGDMPLATQVKLLRFLESGEVRRLGDNEVHIVDARVIAATNVPLQELMKKGRFREDLFYRLNVVTIELPPLRERAEDIELLVEHFLRECGHEGPVDELISPATMRSLATHHWPGNVRELRNLIEATLAMGEPPQLEAAPVDASDPIAALLGLPYRAARERLLQQFEERYLPALLARAEGNVSRAARTAQMNRSHLLELLQRHHLK